MHNIRIATSAIAAMLIALSAMAEIHSLDLAHGTDIPADVPSAIAVGDQFNIALPDDVAFSLKITASPPPGIAGRSFIARDIHSETTAIVKPTASGLRIIIDDFTHSRIFTVRIKDGTASFSVHDTSNAPTETCATCGEAVATAEPAPRQTKASQSKAKTAKLRLADSASFPLAEQKSIVDILVAFDQGAKAKCTELGFDGIDDFADYAVNKMNTVLENSQLNDQFEYRLAGVVEIDGSWTKIDQALLLSMRAREGKFSKLSQQRDKYGADTITLLIDRTSGNTSGVGFEYSDAIGETIEKFDNGNYACNVCDINTVYSRYTMSHETGHNMGCGHSNRQGSNSGPGRYSDSCGYHFTDANNVRRGTVMAYTYAGDDSYYYNPAPYFSTPDISPAEYGCALGVAGVNDNRRTLTLTHADIASLREHVVPYEWDVRFLDDNGNDIPDETYFSPRLYVTFTTAIPNATIYYTYDGSTPTSSSAYCTPGTRFTLTQSRTITACAVTNGVALSVRTITFNEGLSWSGEEGENGCGIWTSGDSSILAWNNYSSYFYNGYDRIVFPDLPEVSAASVTVNGAVSPVSAKFTATETAYTFLKGDDNAFINIPDASFTPSGDITFNVPVKLNAVAFTNPANHSLTFNAPFGQTISASSGYCTNAIGIGAYGILTISPGVGNTQTFDHFSNGSWFYSNARINVGSGTVVFKGPASNKGLFGSTQFKVARDANVVLDMTSAAYDPFYSNSKVSGEGTITYKAVLPSNSSRWTSTDWKGTIAFEGLAADNSTKDFQFENYGNANSKILLRNCTISYLNKSNATFPGTLVLDGEGALQINDGYSGRYNVFGALEGNGSMAFTGSPTHGYVFNTATNYTGSITIAMSGNTGRRVVFGTVASTSDLPSQAASITVKDGAMASIGSNVTWNAYHGIDIAGTLIVKGAGATLDCNASAAMGLKLNDGATLRFDAADAQLTFAKDPSFASGTNYIAFANGVAPSDRQVLVQWPNGSSAPSGNFTFADSTLNSTWELTKTSTGLIVKPRDRFDVPGTDSYIAYDSALESWLDDENFWMYEDEMTWQEFMEKRGANGYLNWQNYILGLSASDPLAKVKAKISFDADGNIVVSVADSIPRAPAVPVFTITCKLLGTDNLDSWPEDGDEMDGKSATISPESGSRFYKVLVELQ